MHIMRRKRRTVLGRTVLTLQEALDLILQVGIIFLRLLRRMGIKEWMIFVDISYEVPALQIC
jgi:hypothetical protein